MSGDQDKGPEDSGEQGDEKAEDQLNLDALLDWGSDPAQLDREVEEAVEGARADAAAVLAAERDEYLDALRRLQADFDNFRKRSLRQQTELLERATEGLCLRLLPVLDALDLATEHVRNQHETNDSDKALLQIDSLLRDTLGREGIEKIDATGVVFDPTIHDAVGHMPAEPSPGGEKTGAAPDAGEAGGGPAGEAPGSGPKTAVKHSSKTSKPTARPTGPTVAQIMRPGYKMKSKVIRPAMVLVKD